MTHARCVGVWASQGSVRAVHSVHVQSTEWRWWRQPEVRLLNMVGVCQSVSHCLSVQLCLGMRQVSLTKERRPVSSSPKSSSKTTQASVLDSECRMLLLCLNRRLQTDKFGDTDRFRFWQCGIGAFASAVSREGRVLSIWHLLHLLHHCIMDSWIH